MANRSRGDIRRAVHTRIRRKVEGTSERPRLSVYRSLNHISAQVIDDTKGHTICAASTVEKGLRGASGGNVAAAREVGRLIAERDAPPGDPMEAKLELARFIVRRSHGEEAAVAAEAHFTRVVRGGEAPEEMPSYDVGDVDVVHLPALLGAVFGQEPYLGGLRNEHLGWLGMLVVKLLKTLAIPLIFFAILDAFIRTNLPLRQGARLLAICLLNVSVAMTIGLLIMNSWKPGLSWYGRVDELLQLVPGSRPAAPGLLTPSQTGTLSPFESRFE